MLFHTQLYLLFFVVVFTLYWALPWARARVYLLLGASVVFYASWNQWLALLVVGTASLDYVLARGIDVVASRRRKRALLAVSIVMNLGVLATFKYTNFFLESLGTSLALVGYAQAMPVLQIIVPFGISFYTFEAISYNIDVYAGRLKAERNLANFLLFILFFPHLVAGPIVRGRDFLRQVHRPKRWSWVRAQHGVQLIVVGLFKKLAIADCMAVYSEQLFRADADVTALHSRAVWMAVFAFSIQIYCDFSGYSDMALGSAHLLGYKLTVNFRMPYFAPNIALFWRRWHISLSNWLRDYVFIPLGGSRHGEWRTCRNLLLTMTLGGLWHGPHASFVVWGLIHGLFLVTQRQFSRLTQPTRLRRLLDSAIGRGTGVVLTFFSVSLVWVFFQPSLAKAKLILQQMFAFTNTGTALAFDGNRFWFMLLIVFGVHGLVTWGVWRWLYVRTPGVVLGVATALLFFVAQILSPDVTKAFVYFQF